MSNPKGINGYTTGYLKAKGHENAMSIKSHGGDHPGDRSYLRGPRASGGGKGNMPTGDHSDRSTWVRRDEMADGIRWARAGNTGPAPRKGGRSSVHERAADAAGRRMSASGRTQGANEAPGVDAHGRAISDGSFIGTRSGWDAVHAMDAARRAANAQADAGGGGGGSPIRLHTEKVGAPPAGYRGATPKVGSGEERNRAANELRQYGRSQAQQDLIDRKSKL